MRTLLDVVLGATSPVAREKCVFPDWLALICGGFWLLNGKILHVIALVARRRLVVFQGYWQILANYYNQVVVRPEKV